MKKFQEKENKPRNFALAQNSIKIYRQTLRANYDFFLKTSFHGVVVYQKALLYSNLSLPPSLLNFFSPHPQNQNSSAQTFNSNGPWNMQSLNKCRWHYWQTISTYLNSTELKSERTALKSMPYILRYKYSKATFYRQGDSVKKCIQL